MHAYMYIIMCKTKQTSLTKPGFWCQSQNHWAPFSNVEPIQKYLYEYVCTHALFCTHIHTHTYTRNQVVESNFI